MIDLTCKTCGAVFTVPQYRKETAIYCSSPCRAAGVGKTKERPIEARFWEKVDKRGPDECWPWLGATTFYGYGVIGEGRRKLIRSHRLSYEMHTGPLSGTEVVRHTCDNPVCVNPHHLLKGSQKDNARDRVERGRQGCPPRKLSESDVEVIKQSPIGCRATARQYGVSPALVSNIRTGKRRVKG